MKFNFALTINGFIKCPLDLPIYSHYYSIVGLALQKLSCKVKMLIINITTDAIPMPLYENNFILIRCQI